MGNCFTCLKSTSTSSADNEASAGSGEPISEKKISHGKKKNKSCLIKFKNFTKQKNDNGSPIHTHHHHLQSDPTSKIFCNCLIKMY
jgi:hypothetical protein